MSPTFKEWFCLNNRETFTIDAKVNPTDARFYFGRDPLRDRMKKQINRAFIDPQVPKMMIYGAYGSGKTQTLYYLAYELGANPPASCKGKPHAVHLDIEVQSKSMADQWHLQMMEALGMATVQRWLQQLYSQTTHFDPEVDKLAGDPNIAVAFKELRGGQAFNAWRWLTGQKLPAGDLQNLKVTRNLVDVGVGDMVASLQALGNLARSVDVCLIFVHTTYS
jgi:DNA polymerase III delta prime subunit